LPIPSKDINALLRLIDDPDNEVYDTVASTLLNYGREIIPSLEQLWEVTEDEGVQERIELLIHRVHFNDLQHDLLEWSNAKHPELLRGAILVAKFQFPDLNVPAILSQFDHIRRNVWLELNNYLTPVEQVNVFNSILYSFYKLQGHELTERDPKYFFINQVLESRQGNSYTIGVIYLALAEILDIPIFAVDVPRQFIFAYIDTMYNLFDPAYTGSSQVQFYVDPISGMIYTQQDVDNYLHKIKAENMGSMRPPMLNRQIIYKMMEELCLCYRYRREEQKADELQQLMKLLADPPESEEE
jgi:regulator of sirC expression with transglutaminase-like and TPR domain